MNEGTAFVTVNAGGADGGGAALAELMEVATIPVTSVHSPRALASPRAPASPHPIPTPRSPAPSPSSTHFFSGDGCL